MKLVMTAIFASMMAVGTAACAKEEPKKAATVVAAAPTPAPAAAPAAPADAKKEAPKTKRVCLDVQGRDGKPVIDPKTGKPKQNCTTVKIREKFEGTKIPEGTKK
jgi:putative IMPACT (imprinted ancient) family translation regulator